MQAMSQIDRNFGWVDNDDAVVVAFPSTNQRDLKRWLLTTKPLLWTPSIVIPQLTFTLQ